jgi:signal transduction histidine kinase
MSLRTKMLLLFAIFAVLPLVLVGLVSYVQSVRALSDVIARRNADRAEVVAQALDRAIESRRLVLRSFARDAAASRLDTAAGVSGSGAAPGRLPDVEPWMAGIELHDRRGNLLAAAGTPGRGACRSGYDERIALSEPIRDAGAHVATLTAYLPFENLLARELSAWALGATGYLMIVERPTGRVLRHRDCRAQHAANLTSRAPARDGAAAPDAVLAFAPAGSTIEMERTITYREDGEERIASFAHLSSAPWVVVSSVAIDEFLAPHAGRRLLQLYLIIFIAAGTAFVFSILLRRTMRSLTSLTGAADQVALGNLTPWLPVPTGDDEVGRLTIAFQRMTSHLKELIREIEVIRPLATIGELATRLSHEMRTPLSSIRLNVQRIERDLRRGTHGAQGAQRAQRAQGAQSAGMGGAVAIALQEIRRLEEILNGVLGMARRPDARKECFHLREVVQQSLALVEAERQARGIEIEVQGMTDEDELLGDPEAIRGAFVNLLRNAIEAMPGEGVIRVWSVREAEPPGVRVHVRDEGPGVSPALRERIFQPFFTTKRHGTGLGLATALATVWAHGGRLRLERRSELETGAEFVVELPLVTEESPAATLKGA